MQSNAAAGAGRHKSAFGQQHIQVSLVGMPDHGKPDFVDDWSGIKLFCKALKHDTIGIVPIKNLPKAGRSAANYLLIVVMERPNTINCRFEYASADDVEAKTQQKIRVVLSDPANNFIGYPFGFATHFRQTFYSVNPSKDFPDVDNIFCFRTEKESLPKPVYEPLIGIFGHFREKRNRLESFLAPDSHYQYVSIVKKVLDGLVLPALKKRTIDQQAKAHGVSDLICSKA